MRIAIAVVCLVLTGCPLEGTLKEVQPPKVVTKVVTEYRDLPDWATAQVPNRPPADGTIEAMKDANNARAGTLDYVNCRSRLLERVGKGEQVTGKECGKP